MDDNSQAQDASDPQQLPDLQDDVAQNEDGLPISEAGGPGGRTPAGIADGGITPANIQAKAGQGGADRGDAGTRGGPGDDDGPGSAGLSDSQVLAMKSGEPASDSRGGAQRAQPEGRESMQLSDQDAGQADQSMAGQGAGGSSGAARTQRRLVPIRGSGRRTGSRKRPSREGTGAGNTDSHTQEQEEWESASRLKAQSRGGQEGRGIKSRPDHDPAGGVRGQRLVEEGKDGSEPGLALLPSDRQAEQPSREQKRQIGSRDSNRAPTFNNKSGQRAGPVKPDHAQDMAANFQDSRTGSGAGHSGDTRGPRAFNYNEDDSTHLNQAYVERVLAMGQQMPPVNYPKYLQQQAQSKPPSSHERTQDVSGEYDPGQAAAGRGQFGARHQSVDVAGVRGRRPEASGILGQPKPSADQSYLSGYSLNTNSPLIEEVRKNNFVQVSRIMEQFISGKTDSGTVTGRDTQQRKRSIKNSFQPVLFQGRRAEIDRSSTKITENPDYPGAVGPKKEVHVPKNLILYQLSKNMDATLIEDSIMQSAFAKGPGFLGQQPGSTKAGSGAGKSYLDYLDGSVAGPDAQGQENLDMQGGAGVHPHSLQQHHRSPFATKSLRTIDPSPNSILEAVQDAQNQRIGDMSNKLFDNSQPSLNMSPSVPTLAHQGLGQMMSPSPALTNHHITDLLERSIIKGAKEREQNKLRQIIEFYKRSVKQDKEISCRKEIMIRNYRLHVVKDAAREIDENMRALFTLNKGTCIHVSNSIIKPEIHKFGTEVSDKLAQVYPFLLQDIGLTPQSLNSPQKQQYFHSRSQSVPSALSRMTDKIYTQPDVRTMQQYSTLDAEEGQLLQRETNAWRAEDQVGEALMEEERSQVSQKDGARPSRRSRQRAVDQHGVEPPHEANQQAIAAQIDERVSSRPFTATDAVELEAVNQANKIFDRWLRNIMSQQSALLASPTRARLQNGETAAPRILDISWQIAVANDTIIKEKPVPLDVLTQRSFYDDAPYRHLQMLVVNQDIREWYSKFILKSKATKTYDQIAKHDPQSMNFVDSKVAIDFSRHHLTHLDPVAFRDDNLPLELFLDYDRWIKGFAKDIKELKVANELAEDQDKVGIDAWTDYFFKDGSRKPIPVKVQDFDPFKARFIVRNAELGVETWRSRLFVRRLDDKREELEAHKAEVMQRKAETLHYLRLHRLVSEEMTKRYTYLRLSNSVLEKIQRRIYVDLFQYDPDSVRKVILQIEALYVFAILKSTLCSQRNDPFIKGLLLKYKVPLNSPALTYFNPQHKEKRDLQGIEDFNMKGIKVELDHNSLLLMDEKYIKMPLFLNSLTLRTIGAHKLFRYPFDVNLLLAQNSKEFRKIKKQDLDAQVNTFPLQHHKFVQAQSLMSKYFHQIARFRWAESIQNEVWGFVKDDFDFDQGRDLVEDQIDPVLLRLFYQLKLYMQTVIFDHFESALRDYMRFLLSFILRDPEIKESKIIEDVKYNPWIRLSLKENLKMQFKKGEIVNDIDLIPLRSKPMILIATEIAKADGAEGPNKAQKKHKVVTRPELELVHKDLFSIILNMHSSLQEIDRIDGIVFPLLHLEDPYLMVPDVKNNEKLSHYVRIIEKLIDACLKSTKKELQNINSYMYIFDKRKDNIIIDLKRRSFLMQQDLSDGEGDGDKGEGESEQEGEDAQGSGEGEEGGETDEEDDWDEDEEDEEGEGEEGYQGNDMQYKSVEIDDGLMKDELFFLRDLIWKVLENIHNQYDFGMVYLDCVEFKGVILDHVKDLIDHLETRVRTDFTAKQRAIQAEIVGVRGKLDMEVESIDDVIMLLDYIDSLKKQDNKIGDISVMIDELAKRMDYIEAVKIRFEDKQYAEFLNIRNWPRTFKQYIEERRHQLLAKKEDLYKEMSKEIDEVFEKIKSFKETIQECLVQGLVDKPLSYDAEDDQLSGSDESLGDKDDPEGKEDEEGAQAQQEVIESADGQTFGWLARQIVMDHMKFDIDHIEEVYHKIEHLKSSFDEVERRTALINKRETLLGVTKTQFAELRVIQDDLRPLYDLWLVASRFCRTLPQWVEGRFDQLDAGWIETKIDEWINELKRLQKFPLVVQNEKQKELQKFMYDSLNHFKRYGPMLRTLRTKGLATRHWRKIGQRLGLFIDPSSITLYRLIQLELFQEEKLKTIKEICEQATKEYAVQLALETLDREMRAVEFEFQIQSDGETVIITRLPDLISMFEEFVLRVSVLKTNPHITSFLDNLLEIEKIIKNVVDLINAWTEFQRHFIYLNGIFVLEEIARALQTEAKYFTQVQALYGSTTQSFQATPQVWRINTRENFLTILMKSNQECEMVRSGLLAFLETKRGRFPRLFFLSNEELIDIFGKGPLLVESILEGGSQAFITNLFEGVDSVRFHEMSQDISHMLSKDGEEVHLAKEVMTRNTAVDSWLKQFQNNMVLTIKQALFLTFEQQGLQDVEEWISSWPGQATFVASQIWFSMKVTHMFLGAAERDRGLRYSGNLGGSDGEGSDEDEDDPGGRFPVTTSGRKQIRAPDDEDGDPSEDEERAWLEEVNRQIAKDETHAPEKAALEKILRLKQRFRIDAKKTPGEQMDKMYQDIANTIISFTGMVRKRLRNNIRQSTVALLTGYVHFRDILNGLMRDRVYKMDDFKWQMQFKFEMKNMTEVVARSLQDSGDHRTLDTKLVEVECEVFGNVRQYGFEYLGNCPRLVVTPLTERCQRSLLVALQYHYGGAPEGPFGTGKTETTKDLSRQVAKLCFVLNCSANYEYSGVCRFFKGLASSGAWVCFDEFNRMETQILSLISQVVISIQSAIRTGASHLNLDESKPIPLKADCAIFITLNPGYAGRSELPMNLKALFRSISMVVPDSVFITEILLYSSGFVGAQQLAKKIVSVQNLANVVMKKSDIAHDFGLRSVKAIVAIAEMLKLQAQNIVDSDLTEIIDDYSLNQVPYKTSQVINEVMTASQARIAKKTDMARNTGGAMNKTKGSGKGKSKGQNGSFYGGGEELVKIDEAAENDLESNASPTLGGGKLGGTDKDIGKRRGLEQIDEKEGAAKEGAGLRDSMQSLPDGGKDAQDGKHRGELYDRLWGQSKFSERQVKSVYRQIGIDPDQHYDEEELEEYIILKAVRDFNHSKFAVEEHVIIEGIIKDIFQGAVPDLDKPVQDYGNLKEAIHQSFEACKIDYSQQLKTKALMMYEIQRSKHGCILVGEPQSGKSTLIYLLQSALNKAAMNELQLAVSEKRRERLIEIAKDHEAQVVETALQKTASSGKAAMVSSDMIGGSSRKKNKKNDKDAQQKKLLAIWQDMYKKTKLTEDEIDEIRANLTIKGVTMRRLNPKGMTIDELFGTFHRESHEWHEGLFTQHYREFSAMREDKKKWILLDGPIDYMWVENLNSILDDNKRMSLPNGESIKMSDGMCILLEASNMKNVTPATVSRCGLIYLHRRETCDPKAIFNQWLRKLPPNLNEYARDVEAAANFLMVEAIAVFEEESKSGRLPYGRVDLHWLMQNFVRLLGCLILDFHLDYEKSLASAAATQNPTELGKSLQNLSLGNKWADGGQDPNMTIFPESDAPKSSQHASRLGSKQSAQRVATPDARQRELEPKTKRLPRCSFIESEIRGENALKFTAIWLESFIVFAMVWTFYPVLSDRGRKTLDHRLQVKYTSARTEYAVYQKEKKRRLAEKNREKSQSNKQSIDKNKSVGRASAILSKKSASEKGSSMVVASQAQGSRDRDSQPNNDGFTPFWTDELDEKPMLISDYPENASFYDYYFNLDSSQWNKFSLQGEMDDAQIGFSNQVASQKKMQNFFVPSADSIRYSALLECLVTAQVPTLVVGPATAGRSSLLRETLFNHVFQYTKQLVTDHVTMSSHTDSSLFKENVERLLEFRLSKHTPGVRRLRPHLDNKLICYVEDLHMCWTDPYGDQPAIEAVRDYLTQHAWLSSRKRRWREIEDVSFFACMASNAPQTAGVTERLLHQFNLIALDEPALTTVRAMYARLVDVMVLDWPSALQMYATNIVDALVGIYRKVSAHLKPTPMKAHYSFSWRDVGRILLSMQMIEANSLKKQANVCKLVYHECYRNFGDRLLMAHDRKWFVETLEEVCRENFYVVEELEVFDNAETQKQGSKEDKPAATEEEGAEEGKDGQDGAAGGRQGGEEIDPKRKDQFLWPITDPDQLYYSTWNQEVEGFYMEVDRVDEIQKVIEGNLERYNDSNERVRVDLMLFNQVNRLMLKMLRVISTPNGHLVNVAMKGYGMNSVIKLVTFAANHQLRELEVYEGFNDEEWRGELRRAVIYCGNEDKPITFFVDEYKMLEPQMYADLECLLRNHAVSEITRKTDVTLSLANIYQQIDAERKAAKFGLAGGEEPGEREELTQEQLDEKEKQSVEQQMDFITDNKKMMQKWPHIQAELYKVFLNRVKSNFHLVLQYTPTGRDFREKIAANKELLYLTQMIFMNDLPEPELEDLGRGFFKLEHEKAVSKALVQGLTAPKTNQYSVSNDRDAQDRVLRSIVQMYRQAQEMTKKFSEDEGQILYLTPTLFLRVFDCYKKLLKERQVVVKDIAGRYEAGLDKIRQTQDQIYKYHQDLEKKSPILQEKQRSLVRVINAIEDEFAQIQGERDQLKRDEADAEEQAGTAHAIREQCQETLDKIIPSLNEAMNSVDALTKKQLAELRSMKKPPKVVKLVLQTVCMLLGVVPAEKRSKKTGRPKLSYWKAAQGPEVLGNPRLPGILRGFDRNKVTAEVMMEVEEVLTNGNYSEEKAHTASAAAAGIFRWVKATRDYFYIFKEIEPRRDAFMLSQKQYEEKQKHLEEKTEKISHLDTALQGLKGRQQSKDDVIEELRAEIQDCSIRKKRADKLLKGLSAEKQKWIVCTRMLTSKYTTVTGDVLLSAGYITLLGGFNQRCRNRLIRQWAKTLTEQDFQCSKEFVFTELFGDTYKINTWHSNLLPNDNMSVNNALVVSKTKRFSLLIDPQMQGITWLKREYEGGSGLTVIKQDDPQFKKSMELAVEMGRAVIVEQVGEHIGMSLQSLMKKVVSKYGSQRMIDFCRKSYKYDKNFKLFVVSTHPRPHFDVNITNHITLLNFSVNIESLQAQMLGLVVSNERKDLDDTHSENAKEAFDSIKTLKDIEGTILTQLEMEVGDLLGDDELIRTLDESKTTAEYVASKLKTIAQTNQLMQNSRGLYAPVAYRAAILYFVVQDLQKVNNMYQFSLSWFKQIFQKSLQLTNVARDDPGKMEDSDDGEIPGDEGLRLLNNTFSVDDRIDLLMRTFTQELFKKIQMAVFEQDSKLITYMLVMRVMEAESFIDRPLFDFLVSGARAVSASTQVPRDVTKAPWLTTMMWADLKYLASLKPFNASNLLGHLAQNQERWTKLFGKREGALTFEDLPNRDLLDLRFFSQMDDDELQEETGQLLPDGQPAPASGRRQTQLPEPSEAPSQTHLRATDVASMAGRTAGDTNSRLGSRGHMKRSESEILNDPDIWNWSDSDDEDGIRSRDSRGHSDEDEAVGAEEEEMARYLVEQAPSVGGMRSNRSNINTLRRKTAGERTLILRREKAVKGLCELCILRCIRPDHLIESMERFVRNVLDPTYFDFQDDLLAPFYAKAQKRSGAPGGAKTLAQNSMSAVELTKKILGQSKMNTSKMSGTNESQSGANPGLAATATAGSKLNPGGASGQMNDTKNSGLNGTQYTNSSNKRAAREEQEKQEKGSKEKKGGLHHVPTLIREAYDDSNARSPILFLVTQSADIEARVREFHQKKVAGNTSLKLQHFSLAKGLEEKVEDTLSKAAQGGDWIILENLHLVEDWLPVFEEKISKWKGAELNSRFRMWITCVPVDNFPANILEMSIKVALQPPRTIKAKMDEMLLDQSRDAFTRKSGKNAAFHKNLFFGLAYLRSIVEGRKKYGALGWNLPYKFDVSDFEVSNAQLTQVMKSMGNSGDLLATLDMLKYFYANINYAGKIQRVEDQILLNAIVGDLFNERVSMAAELPCEYDSSHYGFPPENCSDFNVWSQQNIPAQDPYNIFGFNWNIESGLLKKEMFTILEQIYHLDKRKSGGGTSAVGKDEDHQSTNIQMNSLKTSLRSSNSDSGLGIDRMLKDDQSLLNLFIALQKLLSTSSLDKAVTGQGKRYDHNIDQEILPKRDLHDQKVAEVAAGLLKRIDAQFDEGVIDKKFPIQYKAPLNNVINRELVSFKRLLQAIRESVADLLANVDGQYPRPLATEALWSRIQQNTVPEKWLKVSFQTGYTSLADYLVELGLKLEFWKKIVEVGPKGIASFWLPAFFDPKSFLTALIQTRSRLDEIPMKDLRNDYEVMDAVRNDAPPNEKHAHYIHGLSLEGADWDYDRKLIIETVKTERFVPFPALKVRTLKIGEVGGVAAPTPLEDYANFRLNKSVKKGKKKKSGSGDDPSSGRVTGAEAVDVIKVCKCPLFKTTLRLSARTTGEDSGTVEYFKLNTLEDPNKWTKRAVALLLETDRTSQ